MYCSCDYYYGDDGEPIEFSREEIRKARKEYKCNECGGPIKPKDNYHYYMAKWDNQIGTFRHCEKCWNLLTWLKNNLPCYCYTEENLFEYAVNQINEARERAPEETEGLLQEFLNRYNSDIVRSYFHVHKYGPEGYTKRFEIDEFEKEFPQLDSKMFYFEELVSYKNKNEKYYITKFSNIKTFNDTEGL